MRILDKTVRHLGAGLLALSLVAVAAPAPLTAQDPPPAEGAQQNTVDEEEMVRYVTLQLAIDSLQEEAVQEMARIHSESGRAQIRNNLTEGIAAAHEEQSMTPERYEMVTFLISSRTEVRELFEATMEEIRGEGGDDEGG